MRDIENFIIFLKSKGCYDEFCAEIYRQRQYSLEETLLNNTDNFYKIIDRSISWAITPSGRDYWSKLNTEWGKIYRNDVNLTVGCRSIW